MRRQQAEDAYWQVFKPRLDAAHGYAEARALADDAPPPGAVSAAA